MEPTDTASTYAFTYDVSVYSNEFATTLYIQDLAVGDYGALVFVLKVSVGTKETHTEQEPYLPVSGVDMDGAPVNFLRHWRFEDGDINAGCTYLIKRLRVSFEQYWDDQQGEYVSNPQGPKGFECAYRTALEDATHVGTVGSFFDGRVWNSSH